MDKNTEISDVVALTQALMRCASVTPADAGALDVLQAALEEIGFTCHRLTFSEAGTADVENLYARFGTSAPNFCFAGHTDVVPAGDKDAWSVDPFNGTIRDGMILGRGAADMKAAVAAFAVAAKRFVTEIRGNFNGSISLLITGDEEGPAINGTRKVLDWMSEKGEVIDHCIVGEPTNPSELGEMVKIGRRGSFTGYLTVTGTEGHVAYPHLADNPVPHLAAMVTALDSYVLDEGTEHFQPSNLEFTTIDVGNAATNVIPRTAQATFNIRFNTEHTLDSLEDTVRDILDKVAIERNCHYSLDCRKNSAPFLTPEGEFSALISTAIEKRLGIKPVLSTTGGTSDARFIKDFCPVAEFGLISQTMHKIDERASLADIEALADIYTDILKSYFQKR
ncbi:MAG: succinyl-diaminopimelate desuccinylase [Sneathiella sp.]|jgi:succinyl-diaminopimelate desuccinylase|uniref:succinyl-diaminopimelate desuccinylase n=1 Tax=Sneathiella sp. TaxID=1964365 RepID=UPI000C3BDE0F|nr:succinyl-diaminopimelate desuccinylase [Sneathiella sp.]MAL78878.1 succinyl-diaminopimelate desuccinylase [Sneathiella sp.]|tara:strand:- start:890 stop:2068 length:1179 start_codon:yes stop_codon:yes gene_type:complete